MEFSVPIDTEEYGKAATDQPHQSHIQEIWQTGKALVECSLAVTTLASVALVVMAKDPEPGTPEYEHTIGQSAKDKELARKLEEATEREKAKQRERQKGN